MQLNQDDLDDKDGIDGGDPKVGAAKLGCRITAALAASATTATNGTNGDCNGSSTRTAVPTVAEAAVVLSAEAELYRKKVRIRMDQWLDRFEYFNS